jgi:type VI secretion system secreted protein Hcp
MALQAYLKIEKIDAECTQAGYEDWIEMISCSHGLDQPITMSGSGSGGLQAGQADHQMFTITKQVDKATPKLAQHCCTGESVGNITAVFVRDIGEPTPFLTIEMEDGVVATYAPNASPGQESLPEEMVSFAYEKITWTYDQTGTGTGATGQVVGNFNRRTGKPD